MNRNFRLRVYLWPTLVCAALLFWGCQAKEAPLSPAAATFKKEIKSCLAILAAPLLEPVANKDAAKIAGALEKVEPQTVKLCRMCPFQIGVLNAAGETLAVHPPTKENKNFSNYDLVVKAINSKKIQQQRLFLQDGAQLYLICAPLIRQDKVIGLMAIAISADEAEKRWGLTEKDFLALNFNT
ncbi:MAG: hypothetical protein ACLQUS_08460 [Desulfobaccales bacterium]